MAVLDTVADRQAQWSATANAMKATIDRARLAVFLLSVLGALAAALASQMTAPAEGGLAVSPRSWIALVGVVSLASATFFTARLLGAAEVTDWVRARAIAERLKREAFRYAAAAAPYDVPATAEGLLNDERARIESDGDDLLGQLVPAAGKGSLPRAALSEADYVAQRVQNQIGWFIPKAARYKTVATRLRRLEFGLALAATVITAAAGIVGKTPPLWGMTFDLAALTAVLTTIASAVLAHVEASRFDFLAMTYLATSRRLQDRLDRGQTPWSTFVTDCENILAAENTSWIAKWTK
jgi:hypothetical protein